MRTCRLLRNITGLTLQLAETTGKRLESFASYPCRRPRGSALGIRSAACPGRRPKTAARERGLKRALASRCATPAKSRMLSNGGASGGGRSLVLADEAAVRESRAGLWSSPQGTGSQRSTSSRSIVEAGGLISYSADLNENWRRAASLRRPDLSKGANPARSARAAADQIRASSSTSKPRKRSASRSRRLSSLAPTR